MCFVTNVFINCPFDKNRIDKYLKPMFFCLVTNGLTPKIALESQDSGQLRIDKIVDLMKSSKYLDDEYKYYEFAFLFDTSFYN